MSFRTVYGYSVSENGWRMCNRDECDLVHIPDPFLTDSAPLRKGAPLVIIGAWLYWYDRNVEEITSNVWGWSQTNDVGNSNHLAGTAVDINAPQYPWGSRVMPADRKAKIREGQRLFEDVMFWGEDWNRADQMHHQLHFPEGDPRNDAFANKLLAGYLGIYKPGPTSPSALSRTDQYALAVINAGKKRNISQRGICIALSVPFVESGWKMYANSNVPASLNVPHDAVGSDHDSTGLFQQRQAWGPLSSTMNAELSAGLFYDGGQAGQRGLTDFPYDSDSKTPGQWAQAVQVSAFPDRYQEHWDDAVALYNRLSTTTSEDDLTPEQDAMLRAIHREQTQKLPSRSPLRYLDQSAHYQDGLVDTWAGLTLNVDGMTHVQYCTELAKLGHPPTLALLREVAGADPARYPDRQDDAKLAQAILADVTSKPVSAGGEVISTKGGYTVTAVPASTPTPTVVYRDVPVAGGVSGVAAPVSGGTEGQIIGQAYDALKALPALSDTGKALLTALTGVLQQEQAS